MGLPLTFHAHDEQPLTSNQTITLDIPKFGKIMSMQLAFLDGAGAEVTEAQLRAEVGKIRLTIGGTDIINTSVSKLLDLQEVLKTKLGVNTGIDGVLDLLVARHLYTDPDVAEIFGIGTMDINSIQIQVTAGTLVNVASVASATWRSPVKENMGTHLRFLDHVQNFNAIGEHSASNLPRDVKSDYLMVLTDDGTAGTITHGECLVNGQSVFGKARASFIEQHLSNMGYAMPSGYLIYNFSNGSLGGRIPMLGTNDFVFKTTFSVAAGAAGYTMTALTAFNFNG